MQLRLAVALVLIGCSSPTVPLVDGAIEDASPDAPPDAVPGPPIRVRVVDVGVPVAGSHVLFHDPAGMLIDRGVTDAAGEVVADVPDGSMVTVVDMQFGLLKTLQAAKRGDVLVFGLAARPNEVFTITFPAHPAPPPQWLYVGATSCAGGSTFPSGPTMFDLSIICTPAPTASAMVVVGGFVPPSGRFEARGYIEQQSVTLTPGGTITVTGAWSAAVMDQVAITGLPGDGEVGIAKEWYRNGVKFYEQGATFPNASTFVYPAPGGGDAWRAMTSVCRASDPLYPCQRRWRSLVDPTDLSDDFAATRMPWVADPTIAGNPRMQVTWISDGVPTYRMTRIRVDRMDGRALSARWELVLPAIEQATASITLPEVPPDLEGVWSSLPSMNVSARVELSRSALTYDELRVRAFNERLVENDDLVQLTASRSP